MNSKLAAASRIKKKLNLKLKMKLDETLCEKTTGTLRALRIPSPTAVNCGASTK